ncbi:non-homologous end joining protein Ku [Streptomyces xantholiticus]|uniref:non-homologous end joining protein Ku n=1 Tax=Streptomyces xantholiticus TaxID=68285 RepID=UPI0016762B89|nr:Ku protein [Streptomyces xantholiticus]GGW68089.1 non-homologous end joining protein Ku [Streptomyces xantholiticus]
MRSIWNGAISFGLVSIPIKLVNATENHSVSFRQIHAADGGRIRYRKVCELEEKEVTQAEIGKAYEDADGSMIPITDEDLASLPLPTAKTIEIVAFVPASEIDPLQMDAAYYLSANGVPAAKPYTLLREALKRSRRVAIAKFALRGRERLGMLRVVDDVIAMHGLLWPDEIRQPEGVAPQSDVTVREAELDLADALMDTLGEVDLESLHDDYREAVEAMIAAKAEGGGALETAPAEREGGKVIDLMAALEGSVRAAQEARGEEAQVTPIKGRRSAATPKESGTKKSTSTAKKTPARKAPAKSTSTAAKKSAAKKSASSESSATKKSATKKTAAKKTAARKTAARKTAARKRSSA